VTNRPLNRRRFLRQSAATALGAGYFTSRAIADSKSPSEKLNLAFIATSGQARFSIDNCKRENIAALCDIDDRLLASAAREFPQAKTYHDFRKLLEQKDLDAVVIATPDHIHAPATVAAMRLGKHVYCEKPLTHSVYEARVVAETAKKMKVATQMGTQIHAEDNYRRVVEIIQSGAIGPVAEVHTWAGRQWGGGERPKETPPVPPHLHWDLWLGPAPQRPYHPTYLPQEWRKWWDFGGGNMADMACHHMDLPFWALNLRHPTTVEAEGPPLHKETCPLGLKVRYEFPARTDLPGVKMPALTLNWYDGRLIPPRIHDIPTGGGGNLFVGSGGMLWADYGSYRLYPRDKFKDYQPPKASIPRSTGHHNEWLTACKTGSPTTCNFDYSGALTEAVLLGNVAYRTGKKIEWDAEQLTAKNCPEAAQFVRREYRDGWTL
jgi:predicted dehydrogenase